MGTSHEHEFCDVYGKRRFSSASAAKNRMRRGKSRRRMHHRLRVYECPHCHGWHYSNPEKR